jgi:hypothetical protein
LEKELRSIKDIIVIGISIAFFTIFKKDIFLRRSNIISIRKNKMRKISNETIYTLSAITSPDEFLGESKY